MRFSIGDKAKNKREIHFLDGGTVASGTVGIIVSETMIRYQVFYTLIWTVRDSQGNARVCSWPASDLEEVSFIEILLADREIIKSSSV